MQSRTHTLIVLVIFWQWEPRGQSAVLMHCICGETGPAGTMPHAFGARISTAAAAGPGTGRVGVAGDGTTAIAETLLRIRTRAGDSSPQRLVTTVPQAWSVQVAAGDSAQTQVPPWQT